MSINPTAISIASGIGVTDRCLGQAGFKILVANDISLKAKNVYRYNHEYVNPEDDPDFVRGDFAKPETVESIVDIAQKKLNGQTLDLLTAFIPPNKKNNKTNSAFIKSIFIICTRLQPKLVILDQVRGCKANIENEFTQMTSNFPYKLGNKNYKLDLHGVPSATRKNLTFLFHKTLIDKEQPKAIDFVLSDQLPISIKEALAPVWNEADTAGNDYDFPLHVNPVPFNVKDQERLVQLISPIKQGESIPGEKIKDNRNSVQRALEDKPLPITLSTRAVKGPFWSIHPLFHRGYTPFELVLLSTISDIPFELAPDHSYSGDVIERIANATPPRFLLTIFKQAIAYITDKKPTPLKLKNTFHWINYKQRTLYTGSLYVPRPIKRKFETLISKPKGSVTFDAYEYRQYLYTTFHKQLLVAIAKHPTVKILKTVQDNLTFYMNKAPDKDNSETNTYEIYQNSVMCLCEWTELLAQADTRTLEESEINTMLKTSVLEGGLFFLSPDKRNASFSNFLWMLDRRTLSEFNQTLCVRLCLSGYKTRTEVLSFEAFKKRQKEGLGKSSNEKIDADLDMEDYVAEVVEEDMDVVEEDKEVPHAEYGTVFHLTESTKTNTSASTSTTPTKEIILTSMHNQQNNLSPHVSGQIQQLRPSSNRSFTKIERKAIRFSQKQVQEDLKAETDAMMLEQGTTHGNATPSSSIPFEEYLSSWYASNLNSFANRDRLG